MKITRILYKGIHGFNGKEKFKNWLTKNNKALVGSRPLDLIETSIGIKQVSEKIQTVEDDEYF